MKTDLHLTDAEMKTIRYYNEHTNDYCAETVGLNLHHLYSSFLAHIPVGSHILDAGCGSGRDSLYFKRCGYRVTAFDASDSMVQFSSELLGQKVLHLSFDQVIFNNEFDGVWACASLLHVPRTKATEIVSRLVNALKSGGMIYASLKRGSGQQAMKGRMYTFYDDASLRKLLSSVDDLELIRLWGTEDTRKDRGEEAWINVLAKRR
jgi:2-polyprenyl-3-methyl-5-hydroxy-6-metoxy-1,4-benzoquinol methylase